MTDNIEQPIVEQATDTVSNTALCTANNTANEIEIPDKFKVISEDGTVDYKSTLNKMNESYSFLEKKVGTGEVAPKSDEDYAVEREGFDFNEFKADESNKAFLKSAHAHGITNKQLGFLLSEYDKRAVDLVSNTSQISTDDVVSSLQTEWGATYQDNMFSAMRACQAAGITQEQINDPSIGNNVAVIKALAYFGSQIKEDKASNIGVPVQEDIQTLLRSDALHDPRHPEHLATKARIDAYYQSLRR